MTRKSLLAVQKQNQQEELAYQAYMQEAAGVSTILFGDPDGRPTMKAAHAQRFILEHRNIKGRPTIIVNGTVRLLKAKQIGLGLAEVFSVTMP